MIRRPLRGRMDRPTCQTVGFPPCRFGTVVGGPEQRLFADVRTIEFNVRQVSSREHHGPTGVHGYLRNLPRKIRVTIENLQALFGGTVQNNPVENTTLVSSGVDQPTVEQAFLQSPKRQLVGSGPAEEVPNRHSLPNGNEQGYRGLPVPAAGGSESSTFVLAYSASFLKI